MNPFELKIFNDVDGIAGEISNKFLLGRKRESIDILTSLEKTKALMVLCCVINRLDRSSTDDFYDVLNAGDNTDKCDNLYMGSYCFNNNFVNGNRKDAVDSLLSLDKTKALMLLCCLPYTLNKSDMDIVYKLLLNRV